MLGRFPLTRTLLVLATLALLAAAAGLEAPRADEPSTDGTDAEEAAGAYVKKGTWAASLEASRTRHAELHGRPQIESGPWWATKPHPAKRFAELHIDPQNIHLDAKDGDGEPVWEERPEYTDGAVHGLPLMDHASTYLHRTIHVDQALPRTASLGSDDGIEVWLNGEKLLSHDVPRGPAPGQEHVELGLAKGANHLLLKIHNGAGGHGFYFALEDPVTAAIWSELERDFPRECAWALRDLRDGRHLALFREGVDAEVSRDLVDRLLDELAIEEGDLRRPTDETTWLERYVMLCRIREARNDLANLDTTALRRAMEDLALRHPGRYESRARLEQLAALEGRMPALKRALAEGSREAAEAAMAELDAFLRFRREALLANPLLDFESLLLVKRQGKHLGLPQNWQGNCSLPRQGFDDELVLLDMHDVGEGAARLETFYRPETPRQIADVDLDFDGKRMLFSMLGRHDRWQIWELDVGSREAKQVTPGLYDDVDNYDACYLPDGRILFDSTRVFQGIPCVGGADQVANLFLMDREKDTLRRVCFDQDHDWCPTVLNDGRVLYTRWEYSDTAHYFTRLLFHMNPDGTGQREYYGSNSYWPNSIFYARPVPDHATQVVGIVSGHHGVPRMGELVLFDPAKGRHEADGVVQRIPGFGERVEPLIRDQLVDGSWPKFLHPWPLSSKHVLVSCKPSPERPWGVYLVDVFDNVLCLCEAPGQALFEPMPFRARTRPPVIPDVADPERDDATVFLGDVYRGPGLEGVPRGTVKALRVYGFHYGYNKMGGHKHVGIEGPWDVHRILGTVPVHADGSAAFQVPANMPLAIQPLDAEGKALQVMRSWFTAMPGEVLSCVGCHEPQNSSPPVFGTVAARQAPSTIEPWHGPARGFSFPRDVQPVLDEHCVGCHNGEPRENGRALPDLTRREDGWQGFTPSYIALHPYVRRPGPESDYHLQKPLEWHADTSELIQMLQRGHQGVELDEEAWDRLVTWIDLNVPDHGTWGEHAAIPGSCAARRRAMETEYSGRVEDPEFIPVEPEPVAFRSPEGLLPAIEPEPEFEGWPFGAAEARRRQGEVGGSRGTTLDLGDGVQMTVTRIPAGSFVMGDASGNADEHPRKRVAIEQPFDLGCFEVTCEQYRRFDPTHHNGFHNQNHKDHTTPGYPADGPLRPAIRVSHDQAMAFCAWLSEKTGMRCTLPTEAEWEWACRAGAATPFWYGDLDTDFSAFANLADHATKRLAVTGVNPKPIPNPSPFEAWLPRDDRFDDGRPLMGDVGQYEPNAWGLFDMHGNVSEWTRSPYVVETKTRGASQPKRVVRGGSWRSRPKHARAGWRWGYRTYQPVHDVGFRIVIHPEPRRKP